MNSFINRQGAYGCASFYFIMDMKTSCSLCFLPHLFSFIKKAPTEVGAFFIDIDFLFRIDILFPNKYPSYLSEINREQPDFKTVSILCSLTWGFSK